jgi:predicted nucleotidyltransferase
MDKAVVIERLKAHERELRAMGVARLSLFGSVARGEEGPASDVDLAAEFDRRGRTFTAFDFGDVEDRLSTILGVRVDLLGEPARHERLRVDLERDRVNVF